ncbi:MAG: Crp/Fnr family transcriptional regulator [Burkholderiales bacterium]
MDREAFASKLRILELYDFYRDAPVALQGEMLRAAQEVRVPPGTVIFERGGPCIGVALVGTGSARVYISSEAGREVTLYHVGPGETCPVNLLSTLLKKAAPARAVVETSLEALMLPGAMFRGWMETQPVARKFVLDAMSDRLIDIMQQVQEITFGKLDRRLVDFLMARFENSAGHPPELRATHEQIASELSTAREVVSRLLREFERMGAVDLRRGCVTLRDKALLRALAG